MDIRFVPDADHGYSNLNNTGSITPCSFTDGKSPLYLLLPEPGLQGWELGGAPGVGESGAGCGQALSWAKGSRGEQDMPSPAPQSSWP